MKILIVIPTYNEADNIERLVRTLLELEAAPDVLVVDDSSPDGTGDIADALAAEFPGRVSVIHREAKDGRGGAVLAGLALGLADGYEILFEMDADFSHDPAEIPAFLDSIKRYYFVIGSRYLPESEIIDWPATRTFFSRWANRYARLFLRIPITDYTNGYRCYRRDALEKLNFEAINSKGYIVLSDIAWQLHRAGLSVGEVPTVFVNRSRGESNLSLREVFSAFIGVLKLWFRGLAG
ncbi:MAG: polyprenol monophosphomannose synthase [Candidatus Coatesbacteria bacterium]|nr:MAG: polyprenol monophosphomannose synthase [Candidatus Coatesbacteria bacterium]